MLKTICNNKGLLFFVMTAIFSGPLGDFGSSMFSWALSIFSNHQNLTIDFNDVQGCTQGNLADIAKRQMDNVELTNGADSLTICDNQALVGIRSELPRELANRIPGCLSWRGMESGGLTLVRKSNSVCALPGGKHFLCDGPSARGALGYNAVGSSLDPIKPCSSEQLRRFGFNS